MTGEEAETFELDSLIRESSELKAGREFRFDQLRLSSSALAKKKEGEKLHSLHP